MSNKASIEMLRSVIKVLELADKHHERLGLTEVGALIGSFNDPERLAAPSQGMPSEEEEAFEQLCREHDIAGTAAARQCEVFWRAGARFAALHRTDDQGEPTDEDIQRLHDLMPGADPVAFGRAVLSLVGGRQE